MNRGFNMNRGVYASTAKFDGSARALSHDEMRKIAPSIFAVQAHESRSERFKPIPTIEILDRLADQGFSVVGVQQGNTRDESKRDFTKHLIRMRRLDDDTKYRVGDTTFEILLRNGNDGTSTYNLMGGLFRIACLNSLVCKVKTLDEVRVFHKGQNVIDNVIEGTFTVLNNADKMLAAPADWSKIEMKPESQQVFAEAVHSVRFANAEGKVTTPIKPAQLLFPKREADRANDLWTVTNRIQEHCIRGGDSAYGTGANGKSRRFSSKAVNGIEQSVAVNKAIFMMAEKMAEILKPAA